MTAVDFDRVITHLWPNGDQVTTPQVYALIDGARDRRLEPMIRLSGLEHACLYAGRLAPALERAAPYLVHLAPNARFTRELMTTGWGQSWGILTVVPAECTIQQQRRHFRTLLRVKTEDGRFLVFRFYDPRVLRVYLPTCTESEAAQVFGPIPHILAESGVGHQLLSYRLGRRGVETFPLPVAASA
jgi:Domain of unknown function (DUF4123)